mgnify:CR=1 FL=1
MIGKPKYKREDNVAFMFNGVEKCGVIYIVDSYGTFEQHEEPSYDIYSPLEKEDIILLYCIILCMFCPILFILFSRIKYKI